MATKQNYYTNPAFCQQSEFYNGQRPPPPLSPQGGTRQSPVGAQTIHRVLDDNVCDERRKRVINEDCVQEQEFYEEVLVDDQGFIKEKKFVIVAQNNEGRKYIQVPQSEEGRNGARYASPPPAEEVRQGSRYGVPQHINYEPKPVESKSKTQNHRYEYIPMQEHDSRYASKTTPKKTQMQEDVEVLPGRVHRYAVIQAEEETELTARNGRYALVPVADLKTVIMPQSPPVVPQKAVIVSQNKNRYEYIQESPKQMVHQNSGRYEYMQTPPKPTSRYEYIQQPSPQQRAGNPTATQKLHELLSTPRKTQGAGRNVTPQKMLSPRSERRVTTPALSPIPKEAFKTPSNSPPKARNHTPKAQQKLNYALGTRQLAQQDKRHTAIVAPMCSSPIHSVYSETTYSNKSESWMNLSMGKSPVQATLAAAAFMMLLCGGVTSGLCFYMISVMGRLYFLDFGIVAGFTCLILGLLGFRTRNVYWLPNRNYVSGYLVLSVFSLLTCTGLLVLLVTQPRPGTPLADVTSGAVCGISVLSLALAVTGVVSSYCCKYPPPDNRVQHCAEGFTV